MLPSFSIFFSSSSSSFCNFLQTVSSQLLLLLTLNFNFNFSATVTTRSMDPDQQPTSAARKVRFTPKGPPRRKPKLFNPKTETADDDDDDHNNTDGDAAAAQILLQRVNEHLGKRGPKVEKKSSVQVAFAQGGASLGPIRSYGAPREGNNIKRDSSDLKDSADGEKNLISSPSAAKPDGVCGSVNLVDVSYQKRKKEYKEPWDYLHTNYPATLPLRRPNSGDPEFLDEEEFGEAAMDLEYDENNVNPALELGLLEENVEPQMLFLRLPANLPLDKRSATVLERERIENSKPSGSKGASASAKGKEIMGESKPSKTGFGSKMGCSLEELPGGHMGKLLVYKSGAIKWKLGEVIYHVSPGLSSAFAQDVVAINTDDKHCCALGEVSKRAMVTPDIDSLMRNKLDLGSTLENDNVT